MPLWAFPTSAAEPTAATVKIDDSNAPTISIEARNITVPDLLKELSSRLHFAVEGHSGLDREQKVTVTSKGELADILRRLVLPGKGFAVFYRDKTIDRIVLLDANGGGNSDPVTRQADAKTQAPAEPEPISAKTSTLPIPAPTGAAPGPPFGTAQSAMQQGQVDTLLQTQLKQQRQFGGDLSGAPPPSAPQPAAASSMAALTQLAQRNVLALSSALRTVCIGATCAQ
jgi:hypothetical protein